MTPFETLQSLCPTISSGMDPIRIVDRVGLEYLRSRPHSSTWLEVEFCVGYFQWRLTESPNREWTEEFYSDFEKVVIEASIQALSEAKR